MCSGGIVCFCYNQEVKDNEEKGHLHPLNQVINQVVGAFHDLGFSVAEGPEIEDEFHNFDALNFPADHPSRDMQDTFWLKPEKSKKLLRSQTSDVQIRYMEEMLEEGKEPPLRIVVPGKVYRQEATDARHESQFHQIEGLLVDKNVSVAHLKGYLEEFFKSLYGADLDIRLRPSFFPFVEPGFEFDLVCIRCHDKEGKPVKGNQCPLCSGTGWMEMGGAGLVHPNVLRAVGLDDKVWSGFAFGIGVERLAMTKWAIDDIRFFTNGDLRFLKQF
jgi:phenylalanyl-tRNA synthetase alpha chain